jgi:hypothetical protein
MSEIDRIVKKTIASLFGKGDVMRVEETIRAALLEYGQIVREERYPVELFDGHLVFQHLTDYARKRTSPDNVSDVLDALKRAIDAAMPTKVERAWMEKKTGARRCP